MKMKCFHYPQSFTLIIDVKFNFKYIDRYLIFHIFSILSIFTHTRTPFASRHINTKLGHVYLVFFNAKLKKKEIKNIL